MSNRTTYRIVNAIESRSRRAQAGPIALVTVLTLFTGVHDVQIALANDTGGDFDVDLDGDGVVGPFDLALLLETWGSNPGQPADFNDDDVVGPFDLAVLLGAWGPDAEPSMGGGGGFLLVADYDRKKVLRYDAVTGDFVDEFVPMNSGGLNQPLFLVFGPHDDNHYVGSGHLNGICQLRAVLRYDGTTGSFIDEFVSTGPPSENCGYAAADPADRCGLLTAVHGIIFGPDGNLYVGDWSGGEPEDDFLGFGRILRFDGTTGEFIDEFAPFGSGGLQHPFGMVFAPAVENPNELDLYVCEVAVGSILRYDGTTGAFIETFVPNGSGGLDAPLALTFGPDGSLYVAEAGVRTGIPAVLRYQGPAGPSPGAFIDEFVPPGSGGLLELSTGLLFGPDGNGDGHQDLYVTSDDFTGANDQAKNGSVKRYDGVTGAFIDTFVPIGSGGLDNASGITFTDTDPVTLAYTGDD